MYGSQKKKKRKAARKLENCARTRNTYYFFYELGTLIFKCFFTRLQRKNVNEIIIRERTRIFCIRLIDNVLCSL